jgi:tRNA (guanine37-N1)-methyltransferase
MNKIAIITLFPEMFEPVFNISMLKKAQDHEHVQFSLVNLRDFGIGKRKTVDDTPYGGGAGMILKPEPLFAAVEHAGKKMLQPKVVIMSPRGKTFNQLMAKELVNFKELIILCGHYEGFDERIMSIVDAEISMGDFVLTGGEIPAMAVVDSVVRLIPGVLGDDQSNVDESFSQGLLEYPQYTRPESFRDMDVPEILKGGNHAEITKWRRGQAIKKTQLNRPDLIDF